MLALIGAAIAPGIALLSYFYLRDNLEPEPISMVVRSFIFGVLLAFPIMILQFIIKTDWELNYIWFEAIVTSALVEEFFKFMVVYFTAFKHVEFDEPYDGIVYAVAVSIGFATLENFLYLIINGLDVAIYRAILPVSSHALFAVWMGYYLGLGKFAPTIQRQRLLIGLSFGIPALFHAVYNLILSSVEYWMWMIYPLLIVLWWLSLKKVKLAHDYSSKKWFRRPN